MVIMAISQYFVNGLNVWNGACKNPRKWSHNDANNVRENNVWNIDLLLSLHFKSKYTRFE